MSKTASFPIKTKSKMYDETIQPKKGMPIKVRTGSGKTEDKLKIVSWNVNGIRNVIAKNIISSFIFKNKPDIICINQTKIDKESYLKNPINIHGYSDYWSFCKISAGYSGVAVFTKYMPISVFEDLEEPEYSQEGRVLTLQFQYFYLIAVYVPSAGKTLDRLHYKTQKFQIAFHKHCQTIKKKGKGVIVCGDLNTAFTHIDTHYTQYTHKSPGFTDLERKSLKKFFNLGWIDTFRKLQPTVSKYSWWNIKYCGRQNKLGKRLDYFLVNELFEDVVISSDIMEEVLGSDHSPIIMTMDLGRCLAKNANYSWLKNKQFIIPVQLKSTAETDHNDKVDESNLNSETNHNHRVNESNLNSETDDNHRVGESNLNSERDNHKVDESNLNSQQKQNNQEQNQAQHNKQRTSNESTQQ